MLFQLLMSVLLVAGLPYTDDDRPSTAQQPTPLKATSSRVLPLPVFSAEIGPQCDSNGNLYFRTGYSLKSTIVLKVTTNDGSTTVFRPTDASAAGTYFVAFHITSDQKVAILVGGKENEPIVYEFSKTDPANSTRISLDPPLGLTALGVQNFLVLPNDHILLQGYFGKDAPEDKQEHGYLAEFDSSGKLLRMSLEKVSDDILKLVSGRAGKTAAAQNEDGTTYLLEPDRVVVFSPTGEVKREMKLTPPEPGYTPEVLYMHKGKLVVGFIHGKESGKVSVRYDLVDPSTAERIRDYQPDPELGQNLVCFSDDGLTFMRSEKGHVKLISADLK